jgi:hypothetical protein
MIDAFLTITANNVLAKLSQLLSLGKMSVQLSISLLVKMMRLWGWN